MQQIIDHPRLVPLAIVLASLGTLASAFSLQYWEGVLPCVLCIYQRYAFGAALAVGLAGLAVGGWPKARRLAVILAGLVFLTGAAIAFFHVGVEQHWWRGTAACHAPTLDPGASLDQLRQQMLTTRFVPCDQIPWSLFGISIAGYNVLASALFAFGSFWAARRITVRS